MKGLLGKMALFTFAFSLIHGGDVMANDTLPSWNVGKTTVTLLPEGDGQGKAELLIGLDDSVKNALIPDGSYPTGMNVFLVRAGKRNILVDTGLGKNLEANLRALGLVPDNIDTVLITHMHGDHIGGLLKDGKPVFSKAQVYIGQEETAYWGDESAMNAQPENRRGGFRQAQQVLSVYGNRIHTFPAAKLGTDTGEVIPGFKPYAAFGHTPGHTVFLMESDGNRLLFWGDVTHAMAVQMPEPGVAISYDVDPQAAVASRLEVLKFVTANNVPVAGAHIPSPGAGSIGAQGTGYMFTPGL